jgi:hypothetical protein
MDDRWFESHQGLGVFLFTTVSKPTLGPTQPPLKWVPGAFSLGVKREADHSPSSTDWSRMRGAIPSLLQYASVAWCSVKAQDNFSFYPNNIKWPVCITKFFFMLYAKLLKYLNRFRAKYFFRALVFKHLQFIFVSECKRPYFTSIHNN